MGLVVALLDRDGLGPGLVPAGMISWRARGGGHADLLLTASRRPAGSRRASSTRRAARPRRDSLGSQATLRHSVFEGQTMICSQTVSYFAGIGISRHDSGQTRPARRPPWSPAAPTPDGTWPADADLLGNGAGHGGHAHVAPHLARVGRRGAADRTGSVGAGPTAHGSQGVGIGLRARIGHGVRGTAADTAAGTDPRTHHRSRWTTRAAGQGQNDDQAQATFARLMNPPPIDWSENPTTRVAERSRAHGARGWFNPTDRTVGALPAPEHDSETGNRDARPSWDGRLARWETLHLGRPPCHDTHRGAAQGVIVGLWCRDRDLNPEGPLSPLGPQPSASANSAIPAP